MSDCCLQKIEVFYVCIIVSLFVLPPSRTKGVSLCSSMLMLAEDGVI